MPAAPSKRLRGQKIARNFIIGNSAVQLPHPLFIDPPSGHTKGWRVYVRPLPNGPDITTWLKKVQFKLHHTYADASRTIESTNVKDGCFEIQETGYGEFGVELRLYFPTESGEKAQYREHYLVLTYWGSPEQQAAQEAKNWIVSERVETIEFNEPTVDFAKTLTSEEQFNWLKVKKGRGKGKKPEYVFEGEIDPSALLPEKAPEGKDGSGMGAGAAWSQRYERQVISQLTSSEKILQGMIEEEQGKMEERKRRMEDLGRAIESKG
ncbi:NuA4 histone H4 acetyltransferase complex and the SWR1 complex subunit [Oleoguttula sp. CCFEE 5521]